jgi:prolyl-tRNA editing enzyme YbaK/EbsC (Cys-tRNA(Pro) deacylase)
MGILPTAPALKSPDLLAGPVAAALRAWSAATPIDDVLVAGIDPTLADTAAFCERYQVSPDESANCVVVSGRRGGEERFAACVVLATTRADVNGAVRRFLDVRKASFASTEVATEKTGMEYGGITPIGLPAGWPILVDRRVADSPQVVIGSGVRHSKIALPGRTLGELPGAVVIDDLARPVG